MTDVICLPEIQPGSGWILASSDWVVVVIGQLEDVVLNGVQGGDIVTQNVTHRPGKHHPLEKAMDLANLKC